MKQEPVKVEKLLSQIDYQNATNHSSNATKLHKKVSLRFIVQQNVKHNEYIVYWLYLRCPNRM